MRRVGSVRCGYCHKYGHNRRTCGKLHGKYGDPTVLYSGESGGGQAGEDSETPNSGNVESAYRRIRDGNFPNPDSEPSGACAASRKVAEKGEGSAGVHEHEEMALTEDDLDTWWSLMDPHKLERAPRHDDELRLRADEHYASAESSAVLETLLALGGFLANIPEGSLERTPAGVWESFLAGLTYTLPSYRWEKVRRVVDARDYLAKSSIVPPHILSVLAQSSEERLRVLVAGNSRTPAGTLERLGAEHPELLPLIARNPNVSLRFLARLAKMRSVEIRESVARNPTATAEILGYIASRTRNKRIVRALWANSRTPRGVLYTNG